MTAPTLEPVPDLSPAARADRYHARLTERRRARRDAWRRSGGDPDAYRRIMAEWRQWYRSRP